MESSDFDSGIWMSIAGGLVVFCLVMCWLMYLILTVSDRRSIGSLQSIRIERGYLFHKQRTYLQTDKGFYFVYGDVNLPVHQELVLQTMKIGNRYICVKNSNDCYETERAK